MLIKQIPISFNPTFFKFEYLYRRFTEAECDKDQNPRPKWEDGTPAHSYFVSQIVENYNIGAGVIPVQLGRSIPLSKAVAEILWIYRDGSNRLEDLHKYGVRWWDKFDVGDGTIGNRYGHTIKKYGLIEELLTNLTKDPFGRRHVINLFQYEDLRSSPGLHPCAYEVIFTVSERSWMSDDKALNLDMTLIQRSNDYVLAGHINKFQYMAFMLMVASHCGFKPGNFCHFVQNLHVYDRHIDRLPEIHSNYLEALQREPDCNLTYPVKDFWSYHQDDFKVTGLPELPKMKIEMAV